MRAPLCRNCGGTGNSVRTCCVLAGSGVFTLPCDICLGSGTSDKVVEPTWARHEEQLRDFQMREQVSA